MRLTRFTDLALRVMLFVGRAGRICNMREIANFYPISHEHLRKVVHRLVRLRYLDSSRGRNGGLALSRPPEHILLGQLIIDMEESVAIVDCPVDCVLLPDCSLQTELNQRSQAFIASLDQLTLADFLPIKFAKRVRERQAATAVKGAAAKKKRVSR